PEVRAALKERQRVFRRPPGLVADGRDMGTVIFPDAGWKVFLTASAEERAERRYKQLNDKGVSVTLAGLLREILARDARDASRAVAPLRPADDAVRIDTTGLGIDEVVERVLALMPERDVGSGACATAAGQSRRAAMVQHGGSTNRHMVQFHRTTSTGGSTTCCLRCPTGERVPTGAARVFNRKHFPMTESFAELFEQSQAFLA